jgi:glycosyltransferase involved in cell wall biosynthesis
MQNMITVVTATLNAERYLPRLIGSLQGQSDHDFRWVVADGESTDATLELLRDCHLDVSILCARDFGIYDALNRGIATITVGYYLVIGADDTLAPDAIANFRAQANVAGNPDFVAAGIIQAGRQILPKKRLGWLYGMPGLASSHSVGLLIKRSLHDRFGFYSSKFPIAADQLFVKNSIRSGASISHAEFIAGEFSIEGTSGSDPIGIITEIFRVQVRTERFVSLQYFIFALRLTKYYLTSVCSGKWGR